MGDDSVAQDQILAFYERWERLEAEKSAIGDDLKELFAEAKGNGFSPKALRESFRRVRNTNDASQQEHDAIVDLYVEALTGARPARVREDHSPDAGKMVATIPGNGAGGTEEEASVATYGAASSDNQSRPTAGADEARAPYHSGDTAGSTLAGAVFDEDRRPIPLATAADPAGANDDRGGEGTPSSRAATVVTLQFRTHDPETHFLNSDGLLRLHGCQKPELCASGQPRLKLCFSCSVAHDGPTHGEVA